MKGGVAVLDHNIAVYVSGHGYGHATRTAEVVKSLLEIQRVRTIHIRTTAPRAFFTQLSTARVQVESVSVDSGMVEHDPLHIDGQGTLANADTFFCDRHRVVEREVLF